MNEVPTNIISLTKQFRDLMGKPVYRIKKTLTNNYYIIYETMILSHNQPEIERDRNTVLNPEIVLMVNVFDENGKPATLWTQELFPTKLDLFRHMMRYHKSAIRNDVMMEINEFIKTNPQYFI